MNDQTTQIYNLMRYEFAQVEGDFTSLRESDVKSVIPAGMRFADFLEQLRSGHQVLLTDAPSIPLLIRDRDEWGNQYWRVNPDIEPQLDGLAYKAYTARVALVNHGIGATYSGSVNASVSTEPHVEREPVKLTLAERLVRQRQERLQALDKIQLPSSSWQNAFNKPALKPEPKPQQVFAKSLFVPCGSCDIGTEREALTDMGQIAAYGAVAMNNTTALTGEVTFVEAGGSVLKSLSGLALRVAKVGLSPATAALALFMPSKLADGTLYDEENLRHMAVANTNIRLGFNPSGQIYGYHVKGAEIPVRHVEQVGEKFVVALESDHTLEWVPIQPEDKDSHLTTSPIPALDSYPIWIHPESGEAELTGTNEPYSTPIHQPDVKDYILTFPVESGLPALYVVYQENPRHESGVVTGYGEDITDQWLTTAGKELGAPVPSQIADKLRGCEFSNFDRFRKAFWLTVSEDENLMSQFNRHNQKKIRAGKAPFAPQNQKYGEIMRFEIHHVEEIQHGGAIYDVDNMRVVTPKNHKRIHYGDKQ
ncbi:S-type pyocin domain-containing protein [Vibrio spartinae]|uniref:Colicin-E2 n=1 Tax=Vibrio spartinae TaxID=1918945 RepID=A0ABX6R3U1_9VIBR|nr:S-type pyocin domain-containing protein [Vibrio spartinae]QMV16203.1 Colicin-E2 [Vibrio spartinae]